MSTTATPPVDPKIALSSEINTIIQKAIPNVTEDVKVGLKEEFNRFFESNLNKQKTNTVSSVKEIATATSDALQKLKKELKEAEEEIASKQKDATTAFADAMADWAKEMKLKPELAEALLMIPQIKKDAVSLAENYKKLNEDWEKVKTNKHLIVIDAIKLIESIIILVISLITAIVMLLSVI